MLSFPLRNGPAACLQTKPVRGCIDEPQGSADGGYPPWAAACSVQVNTSILTPQNHRGTEVPRMIPLARAAVMAGSVSRPEPECDTNPIAEGGRIQAKTHCPLNGGEAVRPWGAFLLSQIHPALRIRSPKAIGPWGMVWLT